MNGMSQTHENSELCLYVWSRIGGEWSFDNMITSPAYKCMDLAYDPS